MSDEKEPTTEASPAKAGAVETSGVSRETSGESSETSGVSRETSGESSETSGVSRETSGESSETSGESSEASGRSPETSGGAAETASESESEGKPRVDEDGLPLDREATIDDVRSQSGLHGRFALGCTLLIVLLIAAFWLIRAGMGG
jgi:hypothetical protein